MFLNSDINHVDFSKKEINIKGGSFGFDYLLVADGGYSSIGPMISDENLVIIKCYYEILKKTDEKTSCIISNRLTKGFYGWSIDLGEYVEIGMGNTGDPMTQFKDFKNTFFGSSSDVHKKMIGFIPRSFIKRKVYGNCAIIGDSSGGEPLMGSSIHKSIDEARLIATSLRKHGTLDVYEELWQERFSKEYEIQEAIRKKLDNMKDEEIDGFFSKKIKLQGGGLVNNLFKDLITQ